MEMITVQLKACKLAMSVPVLFLNRRDIEPVWYILQGGINNDFHHDNCEWVV